MMLSRAQGVSIALLLALLPSTLPAAGPEPPAASAPGRSYDVAYRIALQPPSEWARVSLTLRGATLPSRLTFTLEPGQHRDFRGDGKLDIRKDTVVWEPARGTANLTFSARLNRQMRSGSYEGRLAADWAVFRGDRLVPPVSVRAVRNLTARTVLDFELPDGWTVVTPFPAQGESGRRFSVAVAGRRFDRPVGWMLAGRLGSRQESIAGVSTTVAAPLDSGARRQDMLAFLNWNLPTLLEIFPRFPRRLLVVTAGDPMFRGGLSGPASLFIHLDRPLISENRTSTLLHEAVHVGMGLSGDAESDWIVEGFAEYYSLETLRRSGGISERRYEDAVERLTEWSRKASSLFVADSSGATTARAVLVLIGLDREIRSATASKASLDDVARALAASPDEVSLQSLQQIAAKVAGRPMRSIERASLSAR